MHFGKLYWIIIVNAYELSTLHLGDFIFVGYRLTSNPPYRSIAKEKHGVVW